MRPRRQIRTLPSTFTSNWMGHAMTYMLGLDLGTTYTAAAVWRDGSAEMVALGTHSHVIPSVVHLRDDGT